MSLIFFGFWLREISGPPQFLNNAVEEQASTKDVDYQQGRRRNRKHKQDLPAGKLFRFPSLMILLDFGIPLYCLSTVILHMNILALRSIKEYLSNASKIISFLKFVMMMIYINIVNFQSVSPLHGT